MKITAVHPILLSSPLPAPVVLPFHGGHRTIIKRDALLIRVTTDVGLTGHAPGPAHERAANVIRDKIAPVLVGKNPLNYDLRDLFLHASADTLKTCRAVELAILDVVARYDRCPLSDILGTRRRDSVKLYGSAGMYMSPEDYAREAVAIAALGFPAYKYRPALGPDQDLRTLELMRQAVGPDVGLMIDAHSWWRMGDQSYSERTVTDLARAFAEYHPTWVEEPLPPDDHDAYRHLRAASPVPIATGEHEPTDAGFDDLIDTNCADYVQMDLFCQGGLPTAKRIFERISTKNNHAAPSPQAGSHRNGAPDSSPSQSSALCTQHSFASPRFAFHSWGTALEVLVAAHLAVTEPEPIVEWLEHPCHASPTKPGMYPFPLADELLADPLPIHNGRLHVPTTPGLGIAINESALTKYPFIPGPWSLFHLDSPKQTLAVIGDHSVKWAESNP